MTPKEALNVLDQVAAQATGNREVHEKIKQAMETLQTLVNPTEVAPVVQTEK